jgi:hippurate hydrolase
MTWFAPRWLAFAPLIALAASPLAAAPKQHAVDSADARRIDAWVEAERNGLVEIYRDLHAHPELSLEEAATAERVSTVLEAAGYSVETGIGGHGVIGILRNGAGPTLLIRGDMDALPVTEATGLPYASSVQTKNAEGAVVGVMHACGHDVHITNLLGTARLLSELRDRWRGTLVILAQPAEELGLGALHMIEDGLFDRIPRPDFGLALHVAGELPAGTIGSVSGWAAANVDWVKITIHGRGGHGARPHQTVDPIVIAAQVVTALQTIVSRRIDPSETAVVTVGSIHGGAKSNVIPDEVKLELTVRSYSDDVRRQLLEGIREITTHTCEAFGCPSPPEIWIKPDPTPAMYNDPELATHAVAIFEQFLGAENVREIPATMTGEDFARYTRRGGFPTYLYRLGSVDPARFRASEKEGGPPLAGLHSSGYAPDIEPTLTTGVQSMTRLALSLLAQP